MSYNNKTIPVLKEMVLLCDGRLGDQEICI